MSDVYIWRDAHDDNMYYLGTKAKSQDKEIFVMWAPIFCDGILDLFGEDAYQWIVKDKQVGIAPVEINLSLTAPGLNDAKPNP